MLTEYAEARAVLERRLSQGRFHSGPLLSELERELEEDPPRLLPRLLLTEFHIALGDFDSASDELEEIQSYSPRHPKLLEQLGELFLRLSQPAQAVRVLSTARHSLPRSAEVLELLGQAYFELGDFPLAIAALEERDRLGDSSRQCLRTLAELYKRAGDTLSSARILYRIQKEFPELLEEVILRLEEIHSLIPHSDDILWMIAELYERASRPEASLKIYAGFLTGEKRSLDHVVDALRSFLKIFPDYVPAEDLLAHALLEKGLFTEAAHIYQKILDRGSDRDMAENGLMEIVERYPGQVFALELLAQSAFQRGDQKEGVKILEKLLGENPAEAGSVIKKCQELRRLVPASPDVCRVLAKAYLAQGNARAAIEVAGEALRSSPADGALLELLGDAFASEKELEKGLELYQEALRARPTSVLLHDKQYQVRHRIYAQQVAEAERELTEASHRARLLQTLGSLHAKFWELEKAIVPLQKLLQISPRSPLAHWELGRCYARAGRFDLAIPYLENAAESWDAGSAEVRFDLWNEIGSATEAMGRFRQALGWYEKILVQNIHFGNLERHAVRLSHLSLLSDTHQRLFIFPQRLSASKWIARIVLPTEKERKRNRSREALFLSFGQSHNLAGCEALLKSRLAEAAEQFRLALALDEGLTEARANLAVAYLLLGEPTDARQALFEVIEKDPENAIHWHHSALMHWAAGDLEAALALSEKAWALDSTNPFLGLTLGDVCYLSGRVERAFQLWDETKEERSTALFLQDRLARTGRDHLKVRT